MKIMSFNVREWTRDPKKSGEFYWKDRLNAMKRMIKEESPDIICIQEAMPPMAARLTDKTGYKKAGFGIHHCILIKENMKCHDSKFKIHWNSSIINCNGQDVQIVSVHSHWDPKILKDNCDDLFKNMKMDLPYIACGDWNNELDVIKNCDSRYPKYVESARELLGMERENTFYHMTKEDSTGEIDHFMVRNLNPVSYKVIKDNYGVARMSDHLPIIMEF